jgi:hypothetical protein
MNRRRSRGSAPALLAAGLGCVALGGIALGCSAIDDVVFESASLGIDVAEVVVREGAGVVEIPLRLREARDRTLTASYRVRAVEAQDICQTPDFLSAEGTVTWPPGSREATIELWIGDDDLAELDERLAIVIEHPEGAALPTPVEVPLTILDDDRGGLVEASSFGFIPGGRGDQSASLRAALDSASKVGRGVVVVASGDYDVLSVTIPTGVTLSGRGARLLLPPGAPEQNVMLSAHFSGSSDSAPALIEGLTLDGRRDVQGDYRAGAGKNAHLIALDGGAAEPGRLRAVVEQVTLQSATGSGVFLGPQVHAELCAIRGDDLFRDVVTLRGGGAIVDVRELDASASEGTTGLWFSGDPEGYGGVRTIDVRLHGARLATGDLEIEAYGGSQIDIQRLSMTRGPFRLLAPNASVRISDSILQAGIPSSAHNFWGTPHDVEVTRSTLVASETDDEGAPAPAENRTFAAVSVRWDAANDPLGPTRVADPPHRLTFDHCAFQAGSELDANDAVYAIESPSAGGAVLVMTPTLGANLRGALLPPCAGCVLTP